MQQFLLVYNNLFVFLEPVDEPWPTYDGIRAARDQQLVHKIFFLKCYFILKY